MTTFRHLISVPELKSLLSTNACRVVDCRHDLLQPAKGLEEYRAGHIPGAVHADMDSDLAGEVTPDTGRHPLPDVATFSRTLGMWGIGNHTQVIAYDYGSGALAARLWWMLQWLGHDAVAVLDGGLGAWTGAGGALSTDEPRYVEQAFQARPQPDLVVSTGEIAASISTGDNLLILDARDEARFVGRTEPIDSVAGHIPGAVNLPFVRNLRSDGLWRAPADIGRLWEEITRHHPDSVRPVVMCGSGVTACHLALSAAVAGRPAPRLYAGSWSEWIRDPSRPIATPA